MLWVFGVDCLIKDVLDFCIAVALDVATSIVVGYVGGEMMQTIYVGRFVSTSRQPNLSILCSGWFS